MKAIVFYQYGDVDQLKWVDVPEPVLDSDEVLIKIKACALNHLDIWERLGLPGMNVRFPHISGSDIAGKVERVGKKVKGIKKGQRVVVSPGISCGKCEFCKRGYDSLCAGYKMMGLQLDGGYAEYVKAKAHAILPVSSRWSLAEWSAIPLVFVTAWHMLVTRARLKKGETVLVHAAGSGVGSAAIQIAKWLGATVITTASSLQKLDKARKLGADFGIQYKEHDFLEEVHRITKGRGVDVVFEHIGPETWAKSLRSLCRGGRVVTCGATSGREVNLDLRFLFVKQISVLGSYMGGIKELREVFKLVEKGKLKPVVDSTFPLKDARRAQEKMLKRGQFGKIVLVNP